MNKIQQMEQEYSDLLYFDEPIPYKNLKLYPVKTRKYIRFHRFISCLFIEEKKEFKYINMTYLKFLIEKFREGNIRPMFYLAFLLELVLNEELTEKVENGHKFKNFGFGYKDNKPYFKIGKFFYNNYDLEEIKKIICLQQGILKEEIQIDSELKKFLDKSLKLQETKNIGDLEDLIVCVTISTNYNLDDIYKLSIRKFNKMLQRIDKKMHYEMLKSAEMSGTKFKKEIDDWKSDIDYHSEYDSVLMKKETFNETFNNKGKKGFFKRDK